MFCEETLPFAWFSIQKVPRATFHPFAKSWTLIHTYLSMQLHITHTGNSILLPASLRESSKPEEQIQMVLSLASSIQNSRWQDFIWKRTRLTQHLFLLTSHFYDQRFWSFPPLLSRKNTTPELHGKRLSIIWGKYLICFHRHAEEDSLAARS